MQQDEYDAAIAPPVAAGIYGLQAVAPDVADNHAAVTRFVLLTRPSAPTAPTGNDRTTLVAYLRADHSGALLEILTEFATRGGQPDPHRVPADQGADRPVLLLDRLRGAHRRRTGR